MPTTEAMWCFTPEAASAARMLRPVVSKGSEPPCPQTMGGSPRHPDGLSAAPGPTLPVGVLTPLSDAATTSWPFRRWLRLGADEPAAADHHDHAKSPGLSTTSRTVGMRWYLARPFLPGAGETTARLPPLLQPPFLVPLSTEPGCSTLDTPRCSSCLLITMSSRLCSCSSRSGWHRVSRQVHDLSVELLAGFMRERVVPTSFTLILARCPPANWSRRDHAGVQACSSMRCRAFHRYRRRFETSAATSVPGRVARDVQSRRYHSMVG